MSRRSIDEAPRRRWIYEAPHRRWIVVAVVAVVACLPYLNSLHNEFTFDDIVVVRDNPVVSDAPLGELLTWVYHPGGYRPLTMLTFTLNARVDDSVVGFHVVNIALHALASVGVLALGRLLLGSQVGAAVAALLFAVHPIHTEAVTSIVGRSEVLAAAFILAALLAAARAERVGSRNLAWTALSVVAFGAGVLSKESAFTAIPLFGVVYWWRARQPRLRRAVARLLPYLIVGASYLWLRNLVVGFVGMPPPFFVDNPLAETGAATRVRTAVVILWQYLSQLAVPVELSADYSFDQIKLVESWLDWRFLAAVAVLTSLTAALLAGARRAPELILAAIFATVPLALTANLFFPIGTIKAERLLYAPSVGWCLACGWLAVQGSRRSRLATLVVVSGLVAALGARTWVRNEDWKNSLTLFTATVATAPESTKAHYNLGVALRQRDRLGEAMRHYRRSFRIHESADTAFAIARIHEEWGQPRQALAWYERALQVDWNHALTHLNLGVLHYKQGRLSCAEAALRTAVALAPQDPRVKLNLAIAQLGNRDTVNALFVFSEVPPRDINDEALFDAWSNTERALDEAMQR